MKEATYKKIDLVFGILAWGLIGFGLFIILLKLTGIIHSPWPIIIESLIGGGILVELCRVEYKLGKSEEKVETRFVKTEERLDLIWSDFKKRKRL